MLCPQPGGLEVLRILRAYAGLRNFTQTEPLIVWKCKPKTQPDGSFDVDWQGSPTYRVTFLAVGQDHTTLHLVPVLKGSCMVVSKGS